MAFTNNPGARFIQRSTTESSAVGDASSIFSSSSSSSDFARSLGQYAAARVTSTALNAIDSAANNFINNRMTNKTSNSNSDSGNGSGSSSGGGSRSRRSGGSGRNKGNPSFIPIDQPTAIITLNTGIRSGAVVDTHNVGSTDFSPLFLMCGSILSEDNPGTAFAQSQLSSNLYFRYLMSVQSLVNFNISTNFGEVAFFNYMCEIAKALQIYYQSSAILAYASDPINNTNLGMLELRKKLTSDVLSKHRELEIALGNLPCPPRLLQVIRYFYQNFTFSETNKHSAIYRLAFQGTMMDNPPAANTLLAEYTSVLNNLYDSTLVGNIPQILNKAYPAWSIGNPPPSSKDPITDDGFKTFWHNCDVTYANAQGTGPIHSYNTSSQTSLLDYRTFVDDLDGIYYAMFSVYYNSTQEEMGLWSPVLSAAKLGSLASVTEERSSILCYDGSDPDAVTFTAPQTHRIAGQSAVLHGVHFNGTIISNEFNGHSDSAKLRYHTIESLKESVTSAMDWMFSPQQ